MKNTKILAALVVVLALTCGAGAFLMTACSGGDEAATKKVAEPEPEPITNPLTGATAEQGYDENAINQRIVAIVVENAPEARPQWGMDDPEYAPDIILQGEVEGGITRTLWFYADFNKLPEQVGPLRSARPPFIRFSEVFDAVFIHWGQSHTKGNYIGASTVFKEDVVDHINQMSFANECGLYDRDSSRGVSMEHTGILYGDKVKAAIDEYGCRKAPETPTKLNFNETAQPMSDICADEVTLNFSSKTDWEPTVWTYNEEDQQYHTSNFNNDLKRDNLLVLFDETEYITKENYEGPGSTGSVTYCDYALGGGEGKLISQGTVKDIEWTINNEKFYIIDKDATEAAQQKAAEEAAAEGKTQEEIDQIVKTKIVYANLNPGKTWIGWASSNNGGSVEIVPNEPKTETDAEGTDDGSTEESGAEQTDGE